MPDQKALSLMVLVKASPVLTSEMEEAMCVAALTLDEQPRWIRLFPVPFRDLEDESRFKKYHEMDLQVVKPRTDRRPESWTPVEGSIVMSSVIGTDHGWSKRRERVAGLGESTMCDLIALNKSGDRRRTPSLGVVRLPEPPALKISELEPEKFARWSERAEVAAGKASLFDKPGIRKSKLEIVPWRFHYKYRCLDRSCGGHDQTIVDWEIAALWRNLKHRSNWRELIEAKFVGELWRSDKDSVLFVGNQNRFPTSFLVLGVFWPPRQGLQTSLLG